jgi:peroxiredoxin
MNRRTLLTTLGGVTVTGFAGCLGGEASQGQPSSTSNNNEGTSTGGSGDTDAKTGLKVGQKLPDFTLQTTAGNEVSLHPVEKPTALFFMAAWCTSCKQEEHNLKQVHETFGDGVRLISIDMDPDRDSMQDLQQFKEEYGGEWTHAMGTKDLIQSYRLTSLDTTYIIDQNGVSTYKDSNVTSASTFEREFKKLL